LEFKYISNIFVIKFKEEFQAFLRTNTGNMALTLKRLPKDNYSDIVERYTEIFTELSE